MSLQINPGAYRLNLRVTQPVVSVHGADPVPLFTAYAWSQGH